MQRIKPGVSFLYLTDRLQEDKLLDLSERAHRHYLRYPEEDRQRLYSLFQLIRRGAIQARVNTRNLTMAVISKAEEPYYCRLTIRSADTQLSGTNYEEEFGSHYTKTPKTGDISHFLLTICEYTGCYPTFVFDNHNLDAAIGSLWTEGFVVSRNPLGVRCYTGKKLFLINPKPPPIMTTSPKLVAP